MNVELFVFIIFAVAALVGAYTLIAARNPVYSAMGLLLTMLSLAVFYVMLDAHFVAAVQIIIYAGAVVTLFLFVIMLIGVDRREDNEEQIPFQRPVVAVLGGGLVVLLLLAGKGAWVLHGSLNPEVGTIENVSDALFGTWTLPFEATILLLTIAAVGSIALASPFGREASSESAAAASAGSATGDQGREPETESVESGEET
jgi:NADH-quinone oxidoreductase subunit J